MEKNYEALLIKYKEMSAEYANYRKRTAKEKADLKLHGGASILAAILPAIDDLELAIKNVNNGSKEFKQGVCLAYLKLLQDLHREGVDVIKTVNEEFNPSIHNAVGTVNHGTHGRIYECVKQGYSLNGEIVRHAEVIVSQ